MLQPSPEIVAASLPWLPGSWRLLSPLPRAAAIRPGRAGSALGAEAQIHGVNHRDAARARMTRSMNPPGAQCVSMYWPAIAAGSVHSIMVW